MDRPFRLTPLALSAFCCWILAFAGAAFAGNGGAGTYFGLLHGTTYDQTGYVRVVIGKSGVGTVAVKLGDQATCAIEIGPGGTITGGPTTIGGAVIFLPVNPHPAMQVNLSLVTLPQGGTALSGTIIDDWGDVLNVTLPSAKPAANTDTLAGRYTLVLETPSAGSAFTNDIAGFGTLRVFKTGHFIFHGTLSDGSPVFQMGTLNSSGNWELLAKSRGRTLSGEVVFADETQTDCTGDLEFAGPGKNGGPETDVSMQLVGSFYDPKLEWTANIGWNIGTSDDGGSTIAFSSELTAKGDLLSNGGIFSTAGGVPNVSSLFASGGKFASVFLEQDTGAVVGGYSTSLIDIHGLMGVAFQKTSGAFGLTTSIRRLPLLGANNSIKSLKNEILPYLRSLKPKPTGIFAVETTSSTSGVGGFSSGSLQLSSGTVEGGFVMINATGSSTILLSNTSGYPTGSGGAIISFSIGGLSDYSGTISPAGSSSNYSAVLTGVGSFGSINSGSVSISTFDPIDGGIVELGVLTGNSTINNVNSGPALTFRPDGASLVSSGSSLTLSADLSLEINNSPASYILSNGSGSEAVNFIWSAPAASQ